MFPDISKQNVGKLNDAIDLTSIVTCLSPTLPIISIPCSCLFLSTMISPLDN